VIDLHSGQRGCLIGGAGTGKSTLGTELCRRFLAQYPKGLVVIIDTKPRYRATWLLNGLRASYKRWVKGDTLAGSVAIHSARELGDRQLVHSRCVIFQSMHPNGEPVTDYEDQAADLAERVFRISHPGQPTLLYVDETYDLAHGAGGIVDRRLLRTVRAGRERNMSVLMGAQRPRSIPLPILTESNRLYVFELEFEDDRKYLQRHGAELRTIPTGHAFVMAERGRGGKREGLFELALNGKGDSTRES
jgi:hypothetical protein